MDMIDWIESDTGLPIPRQQGSLICSRVAPESEAQKWVESVSKDLKGARVAVVMGLGAGLHVKRLAEKFKQVSIIAVERHTEIVKRVSSGVLKHLISQDRVQIHSPANAGEILNLPLLNIGKEISFSVLRHPASFRLNKSYYERFESALTCRGERSACEDFFHARPDIAEFVSRLALARELSVFSIVEAIQGQKQLEQRDHLAWLALRELVK